MFFRKKTTPLLRHGPDINTLRTVYLVRHGQYKLNPEKLTALGRTQAQLMAKQLKKYKFTQLFTSTMPRAIETASYIAKKSGLKPIENINFREGAVPGSNKFDPDNPSIEDAQAVREAFDFLFKNTTNPENCVVVAHGNVIRHWVCMLLEIDPAVKWKFLEPQHASITTIRVREDGKLTLLGFGDAGHLKLHLRST